MTQQRVHRLVIAILLLSHLPVSLATETPDPTDPNRYLNAVRTFADNVLKYGRDTDGPKHTPLFVDGLNIHTHEPVKWIGPKGDCFTATDKKSGSFLILPLNSLIRTRDGVTRMAGDLKYRQAAMDAIGYAFDNSRSLNGEKVEPQPSKPNHGLAVTLLVNPKQAKALQLLRDKGTISWTVRNPLDKSPRGGSAK